MIEQITSETVQTRLPWVADLRLHEQMVFGILQDTEGALTHVALVTPGELEWVVDIRQHVVIDSDSVSFELQRALHELLAYAQSRCVWRVRVVGLPLQPEFLPFDMSVMRRDETYCLVAIRRQLAPHEVLYEDDDLIAINKPSGLLVHKTDIATRVPVAALQMVRDYVGHHVWPVHRLDRPTSGVLLFAKSADIANELTNLFARKYVNKRYYAGVRGWAPAQGEERSPIRPKGEKEDILKPEQTATTAFTLIRHIELPVPMAPFETTRLSLVEARPLTGRKHQIRRHMRRLNHHVLGDSSYGDGRYNQLLKERFGVYRLLLHASQLSFIHPTTKEPVGIEAPLPEEFESIFGAITHREQA